MFGSFFPHKVRLREIFRLQFEFGAFLRKMMAAENFYKIGTLFQAT